MAVTISASNQRNASNNNTYSYAHVGNTLVLAAFGSDGGAKPTVSTVTFNGNAPTQTLYSAQTGGDTNTGCSLFVWEGLSDVTANIVINFSRNTSGGLLAVSLSGAPSSSVVDTNNIATAASGTSASVSLSGVDAGSLVLDFVSVQNNVTSSLAENGSQTEWATPTFPGTWTTHSASSKSASGTVSMDWTWTGSQKYSLMAVAIKSAATGLSITSVTPSSFDDGRTGIVIAGSGFGASQGSSTLTIGGQAQTVTAWSDTSITFTSVRGSNSMGTRSLTITKG